MNKKLVAAIAAAYLLGAGTRALPAQAFDLGSVLKLGGISYLVSRFGSEINTFINKLTLQKGLDTHYATKVVPILSLGSGSYIGAVQVVGPKAQVDKVKAVGQLEGSFVKVARVKAMIPIDAASISNINRVEGVGVSAIVDFKL
ncbi:hypothetical protein [Acidaminococcus timonensis]|uniref:hypothetical protein n=1 Tax=Acidaminococcus timonensis TaxID=1871002 RepID=UPI00248BD9B9|nr:hypothetical protein [Acidaminococcus timonensis]